MAGALQSCSSRGAEACALQSSSSRDGGSVLMRMLWSSECCAYPGADVCVLQSQQQRWRLCTHASAVVKRVLCVCRSRDDSLQSCSYSRGAVNKLAQARRSTTWKQGSMHVPQAEVVWKAGAEDKGFWHGGI
eukprot:814307-Pelagomonas_calceolata.AAC.4